jgi:hypothetical protein
MFVRVIGNNVPSVVPSIWNDRAEPPRSTSVKTILRNCEPPRVIRLARDIGLGLVERMPPLKRLFIREAAGFTGEVPKLLKGEML